MTYGRGGGRADAAASVPVPRTEPLTDDEFVARAGRNAVKLLLAFVLAVGIITASIGVYGAWRVANAPERSDDGGVECGEDLKNRTPRQLRVCP